MLGRICRGGTDVRGVSRLSESQPWAILCESRDEADSHWRIWSRRPMVAANSGVGMVGPSGS
jgi:hypothetical protein